MKEKSVDDLPVDTVLIILSFLNTKDLLLLSTVSKKCVLSIQSCSNHAWILKAPEVKTRINLLSKEDKIKIKRINKTKMKLIFLNKLKADRFYEFVKQCYCGNKKINSKSKFMKAVNNMQKIRELKSFIKVVVCGDDYVGKTSLLITLVKGKCPEIYIPTIFDNYMYRYNVSNNYSIGIDLWDTLDEEKYDRLRPGASSGYDCNVLVICYDIFNRESFENVKNRWMNPDQNLYYNSSEKEVILVGCKLDLKDNKSVKNDGKSPVTREEALELARSKKNCNFLLETSSRMKINVNKDFIKLLIVAYNHKLILLKQKVGKCEMM